MIIHEEDEEAEDDLHSWTTMDQLWVACLLTCAAVTSAELTGTRMVVKEDSDVVLSCSTSGSLRNKGFDWRKDNTDTFLYRGQEDRFTQYGQFKGRVVHFPEALDSGNASIKIIKAKVEDTGNYTCEFPHSPVKNSPISLLVECILKDRSPGEGVCPEPYIKIVDGSPDRQLLQCDVEGASPKPAVLWQDSSGTVLPALETKSESRDGRFSITIQANVTKTGTYSCVVTQKDLCHQVNSSTLVYIGPATEPAPQPEPNAGLLSAVIVLSVVIACLLIAAAIFFIKPWCQQGCVRGPRSSTSGGMQPVRPAEDEKSSLSREQD